MELSAVSITAVLWVIVAILVGGAAISAVLLRPRVVLWSGIILSCTAVPAFVPMEVSLGGLLIGVNEPLIVAGAIGTLVMRRSQYRGARLATIGLLAAMVMYGIVLGIALSNPLNRVVTDSRALALMTFVAAGVVFSMYDSSDRDRIVRWSRISLWISLATTLVALLTGVKVAGMQASAAGSTDLVERLITPATYPAVAVVAAVLVQVVAGRTTARLAWTFWVPAAAIVALSFTRNSMLTMAVALVMSVLVFQGLVRFLKVAAVFASLILAFWAASAATFAYVGSNWLTSQVEFFGERVFGSLTPEAIAGDGSAQYRFEQENPYLISSFQESPFLGQGMGHAYRPLFTGRAVIAETDILQYFAHNFYLWLLVKVGLVGLILFLTAVALALKSGLRSREPAATISAVVLIGVLATCFVTPMPTNSTTSPLIGLLLGLCFLPPLHSSIGRNELQHVSAPQSSTRETVDV